MNEHTLPEIARAIADRLAGGWDRADAVDAGKYLAPTVAAMLAQSEAAVERVRALADKWVHADPYLPGAFYPAEAGAYADGRTVQLEACADALLDALDAPDSEPTA